MNVITTEPMRRAAMATLSLLASTLTACGGGAVAHPAATPPAPTPSARAGAPAAGVSPRTVGLPPVPSVTGAAIDPRVQYPSDNQVLASRDSNFVLGSVGSGDVQLRINGAPVPVAANGAFIAWVVNPPASAPRYDLEAVRGIDTVRRTVRIRYTQRAPLFAGGRLRVDSGSVSPVRGWWTSRGDMVRVSVRAPSNARVSVTGRDSVARPMVSLAGGYAALAMPGCCAGMMTPTRNDSADVGTVFATELAAPLLGDSANPARLTITRGGDTVRLAVPFVRVLASEGRTLAMLRSTSTIGSDTDRVVNGRTIVDGTYKWLTLPGTVLEVMGRQQGYTRLRLDAALDMWVDNNDLTLLPAGTPLPRRVTGGLRVTPSAGYVDLSIGIGERAAHLVESEGRTLVLTLYGVQGNPDISPILGNDTLIRRIAWEQVTSDRLRITLTLSQPAYGWLALWDDARRAFVLRVRRAPHIDATRPLAGLTIAVDPGHPPAGATGPTGLYEGDAVFPVGLRVVELLKARGANAFSTRASLAPLGLTERGVASRRADAHAFVSIHLNALPDGVNPFTANGTSTLFFHNASEPLARVTEEELVKRFGLRDLGVHYQNLAVARPSWYPSILTEGLFLMMPEQEAAMRDAGFREQYAEAIVAGLERYFVWLRDGGK